MTREMRRGRLILVRHGESQGNEERRFSHDTEIRLTELGIEQARSAGQTIARHFRPVEVVASPFHRARHTAELIAATIGHEHAIRIEHDLRERAIGELAGQPYSTMRHHPTYTVDRFWEWRPEGGESLADVQLRAARVLEAIMRAHPDEEVVVVSHGGVMLALCAHIEGGWLRPRVARNCELVLVTHEAGKRPRLEEFAAACAPDDNEPPDATG